VIENAQRDLNIAFTNESLPVRTGGPSTSSQRFTARAFGHLPRARHRHAGRALGGRHKWNFLNFTPGLVGGHCIGVDPYYFTCRAQKAGYHPDVIFASRRINDSIGVRVARECLRRLLRAGTPRPRVTVLGLTFKENVVDVRNSQVFDIIREFQSFGVSVQVHDPLADSPLKEYGSGPGGRLALLTSLSAHS
jgi:UDP-N-acetyl-D-galactosamine dehydrogenase